MYYLYVVKCSDGTLYTGITTDIDRRINEHNRKKGAKYTRAKGPVRLVHQEKHRTRSGALKKETEIKKYSRKEKIELIENQKFF